MTTTPGRRLVVTGRHNGTDGRWTIRAAGLPATRPGFPPDGVHSPLMTASVLDSQSGLDLVAISFDNMLNRWQANPW